MSATTIQMFLFDASPIPAPVVKGNAGVGLRFELWAYLLKDKIDYAGRPMTQNPTPKRNREYQSRMIDCRNLERLQKALQVLSAGHLDGSIPDELAHLRSKDDIQRLVRKSMDGSKGGHFSCIEADDFYDKSPVARMLQEMIDVPSAQRAERDRLRKIAELEASIALSSIPGYFPTQPPVVAAMLGRASIEDGMTVLEPSAGSGNIADAIKAKYAVTVQAIEPNYTLRQLLTLKGYKLIGDDIMETPLASYDRIVMNPPFEKQADIAHIRRAYDFLKPDGVLVSILSPSFEYRTDRKSVEFREWLESVGADWENLPDGSFKKSGTGVSTRMLVIEK